MYGMCFLGVCVFQEFHVRRLHCLLTDFIVLMPLKLKELRNRADETARTMQVYTHVRHAHKLLLVQNKEKYVLFVYSKHNEAYFHLMCSLYVCLQHTTVMPGLP
jgi:nuclear pore complex protein Nup205